MTYAPPPRRSSALPAILVTLVVLALIALGLFILLSYRGSGAVPSPPGSPSPVPTSGFNEELLNRRWTVLVVGTDVNAGRESRGEPVNTDALQLVSLDENQSQLSIIGVPRDLTDIPLPNGQTWTEKANAIYRQEGIESLVAAMETLFEVDIHAYLVLDMDDFVEIVDAVGGVEVEVEERLEDPIVDLSLEPGRQELDPQATLAYVRTRVDEDYGRVRRQGEVITAVLDRLVEPEREVNVAAILEGLDSLETDLPLEELPTLVELARRAADASVEQVVLEPPEYIGFEGDRGDGRGYILEPNVDAIRETAGELIGE
jgi:LCP family protein required for cell wall assembly